MTVSTFLIVLVLALITAVPVVLFVPRARRSAGFDRLLWAATALVAFLGAWLGIGYGGGVKTTGSAAFDIAVVPIIPALIGGLLGALITTLPLWLLDRFERNDRTFDDEGWEDSEPAAPEEPESPMGEINSEEIEPAGEETISK